jgi:hypothetical protein
MPNSDYSYINLKNMPQILMIEYRKTPAIGIPNSKPTIFLQISRCPFLISDQIPDLGVTNYNS